MSELKLTQQQRDVLNLVARSPVDEEGWRKCSPILFEKLIEPMPDSLVEKRASDGGLRYVRLTAEATTILKWT